MARPKPMAKKHRHSLTVVKDAEQVVQCDSCLFRCSNDPAVIRRVMQYPDLHLVVTHRSPEALKAVYRG